MYAGMLFSLAEAAGGALAFASFGSSLVPLAEKMSITYIKPALTDITTDVSLSLEEIASIAHTAETTGKAPLELRCQLVDTEGEVVATTIGRYQMMRADRVDVRQVESREAGPDQQLLMERSPTVQCATGLAIAGMTCGLAGNTTLVEQLWTSLLSRRCHITHSPPQRWQQVCKAANVPPGVLAGAFLSSELKEALRHPFGGFKAAEASQVDVHIQMLLDATLQALEDAGLERADLKSTRLGVFTAAGLCNFVIPAPGHSVARAVASVLRVCGPHVNCDAACSSAYLAICSAQQELEAGRCPAGAVVAGVSPLLVPFEMLGLYTMGALSPSGTMRPFDSRSDGMVWGEESVALVLQDGTGHSRLVGSAANCNSALSPTGFVDSTMIQQAAVDALKRAAALAKDLAICHPHGMGNLKSDLPELAGLLQVLSRQDKSDPHLILAGHKANFGHSAYASGVCAVVMSTLALQHSVVPVHLGVADLVPILRRESSVVLPSALYTESFVANRRQICGSVSGTSASGDNVHLVLGQNDGEGTYARKLLTASCYNLVQSSPQTPKVNQVIVELEARVKKLWSMKRYKEASEVQERIELLQREEFVPISIDQDARTEASEKPLAALAARKADLIHVQQTVTEMIRDQTGGLNVALVQPLMAAGITSRQSVAIATSLSQQLGVALSPVDLFNYPTIASLAEHLASRLGLLTMPTATYEEQLVVSSQSKCNAADQPRTQVTGASCMVPGQAHESLVELYKLLSCAHDSLQQIPAQRFNNDIVPTQHGHFVQGAQLFEPSSFQMSPAEVKATDPHHRLLLQAVHAACVQAGDSRESLLGSWVGMFLGFCSDFGWGAVQQGSQVTVYSAHGSGSSAAAGRVSYLFGLKGPCFSVNTACSSSLVALDAGLANLRLNRCGAALVGAVNLQLEPGSWVGLDALSALAPDGECKTFDSRADGFGRSEACGAVLLEQAEAGLVELCDSTCNQDGRSASFMAPNGPSQEAVIRAAMAQHTVLDVVEAHGTGTALGDPIELGALHRVLGSGSSAEHPVEVGAIKSLMAHSEGAAGMAGLLKLVVLLRTGTMPPSLQLQRANPKLELDGFRMGLPSQIGASCRAESAGVSSFGYSGTNAHAVLSYMAKNETSHMDKHNMAVYSRSAFAWWERLQVEDPTCAETIAETVANHVNTLAVEQPKWDSCLTDILDSFAVVELTRLLSKSMNRLISADALFAHPSINQLAKHLSGDCLEMLEPNSDCPQNDVLKMEPLTARPDATLRLFCAPPFGFGRKYFEQWDKDAACEIWMLGNELAKDWVELLNYLCTNVAQICGDGKPFVIFGHSFGSIIAFEVAAQLQFKYSLQPNRLCVSQCPAPDLAERLKLNSPFNVRSGLDLFIREAEAVTVLPPPELGLCILDKASINCARQMVQSYKSSSAPLKCDILAVFANNDVMMPSAEPLARWQHYTSGAFSVLNYDGTHMWFARRPAPWLEARIKHRGQPRPVTELGTFEIVSMFHGTPLNKAAPFGSEPKGFLAYLDGHVVVQLWDGYRCTDSVEAAALTFVAYYGTYSLKNGIVTHTIKHSTHPNDQDDEWYRFAEVNEDDELVLRTAPQTRRKLKLELAQELSWRRVTTQSLDCRTPVGCWVLDHSSDEEGVLCISAAGHIFIQLYHLGRQSMTELSMALATAHELNQSWGSCLCVSMRILDTEWLGDNRLRLSLLVMQTSRDCEPWCNNAKLLADLEVIDGHVGLRLVVPDWRTTSWRRTSSITYSDTTRDQESALCKHRHRWRVLCKRVRLSCVAAELVYFGYCCLHMRAMEEAQNEL